MCPFCGKVKPVLENELAFAIPDRFPVTRGHLLVIPQRHVADYFEASPDEKAALWDLVEKARAHLHDRYAPDGFNIGINVGEAAGQTVMHLHIHVIPRYHGDTADPTGGVRGVIPGKQTY